MALNPEKQRLKSQIGPGSWRKWGPYLSERQWGTVREDYSPNGDAWNFVSHEQARSNAYRWGEEGIAGFCDFRQILCFAPAFWNGKDPILKERLFGLTNNQGNHGEDVKELYFHLDNIPTHSYCRYLYKYPHNAFPYQELVLKNQITKDKTEFEILNTEAFRNNEYFDCYIEYAKADTEDILMQLTIYNRSEEDHEIHAIPQLWFRNYWKHNPKYDRPTIRHLEKGVLVTDSDREDPYYLHFKYGQPLFCENETNNKRIYKSKNDTIFVKDGINDFVVNRIPSVNPGFRGSKCGIWCRRTVKGLSHETFQFRLSSGKNDQPWEDFTEIFEIRKKEANLFYNSIIPENIPAHHKKLLKDAFSGLLWTKQFYYYDVFKWLKGGPGEKTPARVYTRNEQWQHLVNRDIISMPDKWEYPWYAAWDLAFHTVTFSEIDPQFAKGQLELMLTDDYMHPNGQIPAYEWNFSDVNPPVHSWAVLEVFTRDRDRTGVPDFEFLSTCYHKLLINFTWWVNQKDKEGNALFEGGFLGLDNIGVFDRNHMPKGITKMQQSDATSWMALFTLNMLRMSLKLATYDQVYEESAFKFARQFLNIGWSMHHIGGEDISLWDEKDAFYYDAIRMNTGYSSRLKVRSLVGIIPLFAVEVIHESLINTLSEFLRRARKLIKSRPDLAALISRIEEKNEHGYYLFSIMRGYRLEHVLKRMLDTNEFLSEYGIRSLSKIHESEPFVFEHFGEHKIEYVPGESLTSMFGGNSNWRGPIWLPLNYLIIRSLLKFYKYFGPTYVYEFPTGSKNKLNLKQIAIELTKRLLRLFEKNEKGKYQYHSEDPAQLFTEDIHFKDLHLFYEFFHGETGRGLGASHQTGWTALVANLILELEVLESKTDKSVVKEEVV